MPGAITRREQQGGVERREEAVRVRARHSGEGARRGNRCCGRQQRRGVGAAPTLRIEQCWMPGTAGGSEFRGEDSDTYASQNHFFYSRQNLSIPESAPCLSTYQEDAGHPRAGP